MSIAMGSGLIIAAGYTHTYEVQHSGDSGRLAKQYCIYRRFNSNNKMSSHLGICLGKYNLKVS